jgi:GTP cyclohydrolase I
VLVCWWVVQLTADDARERCKMAKSATLGVIRVRVLSTSTRPYRSTVYTNGINQSLFSIMVIFRDISIQSLCPWHVVVDIW